MTIPNTHPETGIKYGVSSSETPDWFWDEAEPHYTPGCGYCGETFPEDFEDTLECENRGSNFYKCPSCERWNEDHSCYSDEPDAWVIDTPEFKAHSTDGIHVFVTLSPHIVQARECSPCFPLAGDLGSLEPGGFDTYGWEAP